MSIAQKVFNRIHNSQLIYNICWEDPDIDRKLMKIDAESEIVMITSAGCNALCYLLDSPKHINCVDMNPKQNAVLALKISLIKYTDFDTFFKFFGQGNHPNALAIYHQKLRPTLNDTKYIAFWDKHIKHINNGTYHYSGTSGKMAKWIVRRMRNKKAYPLLLELFKETKKARREELFDRVFFKTFPKKLASLVNSNLSMSMLGVPEAQKKLIEADEGTVYNFIYTKLKYIFTELPINENYFWKFYLQGFLNPTDAAPAYLQETNFEKLRQLADRISLHSTSIESFLKNSNHTYSHFVLLDHQDWMAYNRPDLLANEWEAIFNKSKANTAYLLRSASKNRVFLPSWVQEKITFQDEITQRLHLQDRVGTYASTHFGYAN